MHVLRKMKIKWWIFLLHDNSGSVRHHVHNQTMCSCLCCIKKNLLVIVSAVAKAQNKPVSLQSLKKPHPIQWPMWGGMKSNLTCPSSCICFCSANGKWELSLSAFNTQSFLLLTGESLHLLLFLTLPRKDRHPSLFSFPIISSSILASRWLVSLSPS